MKSYKETASAVLERRDECIKRRKETAKFVSVVTVGVLCLCLVAVLGFDLLSPKKPISVALGGAQTDSMIDGDAPDSVQSKFNGENEFTTSKGESQSGDTQDVYLPAIFINELEKIPAAASKLYYDPEKYDKIELSEQQTQEYFGTELVPEGAVREPLKKFRGDGSVHYIEKQSGKIVYDTAHIVYASGVYDDGSRLSPVDGGSNLTVSASRLGRPNVCYAWGDGKSTEVKGVEVYAGKIEVGYNYNEQKEPQNFYIRYFAEFEVNGIYYEVDADNISETEFIRAVWGIIAH